MISMKDEDDESASSPSLQKVDSNEDIPKKVGSDEYIPDKVDSVFPLARVVTALKAQATVDNMKNIRAPKISNKDSENSVSKEDILKNKELNIDNVSNIDGDACVNKSVSTIAQSQLIEEDDFPTIANEIVFSSYENNNAVDNLRTIEIQHNLDAHYDSAIVEREILWNARFTSVRQCAFVSLMFFFMYLLAGTLFYKKHTEWALTDCLLFSIYTITTVGYGNHVIPDTTVVQIFTIFYIFIGITTLTVFVAQAYQYLSLEATRAQFSRDKNSILRRNSTQELELVTNRNTNETENSTNDFKRVWNDSVMLYKRILFFLNNERNGKIVKRMLPHFSLIFIGAIVVGPIEGWSFFASIYWSVVSLTTVGYGDYYPDKRASAWFCIFYLPCSIGFMSLFLADIANFYIQFSNRNIQRIERKLRKELAKQHENNDSSLGEVDSFQEMPPNYADAGFSSLPKSDDRGLFGFSGDSLNDGIRRREQILQESNLEQMNGQSMKDILKITRESLKISSSSLDTSNTDSQQNNKPSFALRVLVQERFANIIAVDIAGYQSAIEIKDNTLSISIKSISQTADKWMIVPRARKAFRSVAFEVLFFVGEHALITRGSQALFDLSPIEFHRLFGPLLAAMGDKQSMENWLANTNILADVELKRDTLGDSLFSNFNALNTTPSLTSDRYSPLPSKKQSQDHLPDIC